MPSILVVPVGAMGDLDLTALSEPLNEVFRLPVSIHIGSPLDPQAAFDTFRNQYNSTLILTRLLDRYGQHDGKVLGVTMNDLFVPVLTYVFGEAQLSGTAAVVSAHRLMEEFYGLTPDPAMEHDRLLKESVHELGHTFGLVHCHEPECVMRSSNAVEDIDLKDVGMCDRCRSLMEGTA